MVNVQLQLTGVTASPAIHYPHGNQVTNRVGLFSSGGGSHDSSLTNHQVIGRDWEKPGPSSISSERLCFG